MGATHRKTMFGQNLNRCRHDVDRWRERGKRERARIESRRRRHQVRGV